MWEVDAGEGVWAEVFVAASLEIRSEEALAWQSHDLGLPTVLILSLVPGTVTRGILRWLLRATTAASKHVLEELELRGRG